MKKMTANQVRMILVVTGGLALWGTMVLAQMVKSQEPSSPQKAKTPQFKDYPVVEEFRGKPASVDLSSHPYARTFRTRLSDGAKKGVNFAGHYALVWWGCGNECQESLVIDLPTGKVYGLAKSRRRLPLQSSRGLEFGPTSKLIIADPPCPEDYNPCLSLARSGEPVRYYLMEDDGLKLIHKTPCKVACWRIPGAEIIAEWKTQCGDSNAIQR